MAKFQQLSLSSLFTIKATLLPVGQIDEASFRRFAALIQDAACCMTAADLHYQQKGCPFVSLSPMRSRIRFEFVDPLAASAKWDDFAPYKQTLAVIGIGHCPAAPNKDLRQLYQQYLDQLRLSGLGPTPGSPAATTCRYMCYAFEPLESQADSVDGMIVFPDQGQEKLRQYVRQHVHDLASQLIDQLGARVRALTAKGSQVDLQSPWLVDSAPTDDRRSQMGRLAKHIGDLCLLAGSPADAMRYYASGGEQLRASNDWLWFGACLEMQAAALLSNQWESLAISTASAAAAAASSGASRPSGHSSRSSSSSDIPGLLQQSQQPSSSSSSQAGSQPQASSASGGNGPSPEIVDCLQDALSCFEKCRFSHLAQIETGLRLCKYWGDNGSLDPATAIMSDVLQWRELCSLPEQVGLTVQLAVLSHQLGLRRRMGLFLFQAAQLFYELRRFDCQQAFLAVLAPIYGLDADLGGGGVGAGALGGLVGGLLPPPGSGAASPGAGGDLWDPEESPEGPQGGWIGIKCTLLQAAIRSAKAQNNRRGAVVALLQLLQRFHPQLGPAQQRGLEQQLRASTAVLAGSPLEMDAAWEFSSRSASGNNGVHAHEDSETADDMFSRDGMSSLPPRPPPPSRLFSLPFVSTLLLPPSVVAGANKDTPSGAARGVLGRPTGLRVVTEASGKTAFVPGSFVVPCPENTSSEASVSTAGGNQTTVSGSLPGIGESLAETPGDADAADADADDANRSGPPPLAVNQTDNADSDSDDSEVFLFNPSEAAAAGGGAFSRSRAESRASFLSPPGYGTRSRRRSSVTPLSQRRRSPSGALLSHSHSSGGSGAPAPLPPVVVAAGEAFAVVALLCNPFHFAVPVEQANLIFEDPAAADGFELLPAGGAGGSMEVPAGAVNWPLTIRGRFRSPPSHPRELRLIGIELVVYRLRARHYLPLGLPPPVPAPAAFQGEGPLAAPDELRLQRSQRLQMEQWVRQARHRLAELTGDTRGGGQGSLGAAGAGWRLARGPQGILVTPAVPLLQLASPEAGPYTHYHNVFPGQQLLALPPSYVGGGGGPHTFDPALMELFRAPERHVLHLGGSGEAAAAVPGCGQAFLAPTGVFPGSHSVFPHRRLWLGELLELDLPLRTAIPGQAIHRLETELRPVERPCEACALLQQRQQHPQAANSGISIEELLHHAEYQAADAVSSLVPVNAFGPGVPVGVPGLASPSARQLAAALASVLIPEPQPRHGEVVTTGSRHGRMSGSFAAPSSSWTAFSASAVSSGTSVAAAPVVQSWPAQGLSELSGKSSLPGRAAESASLSTSTSSSPSVSLSLDIVEAAAMDAGAGPGPTGFPIPAGRAFRLRLRIRGALDCCGANLTVRAFGAGAIGTGVISAGAGQQSHAPGAPATPSVSHCAELRLRLCWRAEAAVALDSVRLVPFGGPASPAVSPGAPPALAEVELRLRNLAGPGPPLDCRLEVDPSVALMLPPGSQRLPEQEHQEEAKLGDAPDGDAANALAAAQRLPPLPSVRLFPGAPPQALRLQLTAPSFGAYLDPLLRHLSLHHSDGVSAWPQSLEPLRRRAAEQLFRGMRIRWSSCEPPPHPQLHPYHHHYQGHQHHPQQFGQPQQQRPGVALRSGELPLLELPGLRQAILAGIGGSQLAMLIRPSFRLRMTSAISLSPQLPSPPPSLSPLPANEGSSAVVGVVEGAGVAADSVVVEASDEMPLVPLRWIPAGCSAGDNRPCLAPLPGTRFELRSPVPLRHCPIGGCVQLRLSVGNASPCPRYLRLRLVAVGSPDQPIMDVMAAAAAAGSRSPKLDPEGNLLLEGLNTFDLGMMQPGEQRECVLRLLPLGLCRSQLRVLIFSSTQPESAQHAAGLDRMTPDMVRLLPDGPLREVWSSQTFCVAGTA